MQLDKDRCNFQLPFCTLTAGRATARHHREVIGNRREAECVTAEAGAFYSKR
jgi:hypothetical protein